MKKILTPIFVGLGVVFLGFILISMYFFIADPYEVRPLLFGSPMKVQVSTTGASETKNTSAVTATGTATAGFELSASQKQALVGLGIDPATVPSSVSATQEACFVGVLGEVRVEEIKAGAVPNALEFFKAKSCI